MRIFQRLQGIAYIAGGLWPVFHMASFEKATGRKTDKWLVRTVGLLTAGIGWSLWRAKSPKDARRLGALSAASFGAIDGYYTKKGRISKMYALDGLIQAGLIFSWLRHRHNHKA